MDSHTLAVIASEIAISTPNVCYHGRLQTPSARDSSVESTPVSTPHSTGFNLSSYTTATKNPAADREVFFNAHFQSGGDASEELSSDELLFPCDQPDTDFDVPLYPSAHPLGHAAPMVGPVDIAPNSRHNSRSPPSKETTENASQFQRPSISIREEPNMEDARQNESQYPGLRKGSIGMLGTTPYGTRSIPVRGGDIRRESNALSGSLMNGMSWGGISVGSFIKDDILMAGTSPYNFQSPSFHSSSYLPKMEANYMKDYVCCDIRLDSMHELLQHYEEAHAAQPTQTMGRTPKDQQYPSSRAANATSTAQAVQQQSQSQQGNIPATANGQQTVDPSNATSPMFSGQSQDQFELDNLEDMEMDNAPSHPPSGVQSPTSQFQPQPQFGRQQPRGPSLNVNIANAFQGQALSTPSTPRPGQQNVMNNPTVSSVNTPTMSTASASLQTATPDSSMPGTPAEPADADYSQFGNLNMDYNQMMQNGYDFSNFNMNGAGNMGNMQNSVSGTIDDPAKRLLSKQGGNKGFPNPAFAQNSELAKRIRETQLLNGLAGVGGFVGEEIKPFKCPVIGCEKAYKNQNGLKYHKQHGHQNQQLKENPDGTFSIVDPTTSIPYPGTVGMEKEKPYRCEVCGKRYKNLNGLKYHRQHSPPCNPELKLNAANFQNVANNAQGMGVNVAGAGLVGIGDGMNGY
ncbi:hypothetical protein KC360_g8829 [Hortaea werneckii]|nr:hypothetical protein KC361_g9093 [Hortaea werneckii]KAI6877915.1 hypothetical protein KC325_g8958 [Hortaea werneckii]KAI6985911.1 hypothetical protein KC359_g8975 [Hortaea werneckii]KAI7140249.1 hypothetical protein KC344_g8850 [Hortaea werneckii]KAI7167122.1 hypothetical protein KC360_g8829 [Hortaea werneckii]